MNKVALSSTDKLGLRVLAHGFDMSLRIHYANDAEAGRFCSIGIRELSLLKFNCNDLQSWKKRINRMKYRNEFFYVHEARLPARSARLASFFF